MIPINFSKNNDIVPAIIQDFQSGEIFMLGYMNETAYKKTIETGWVHFFSRRRKKLWMKGETSGNKLKVNKILIDCDGDTLLIHGELVGTHICHTGSRSCFKTYAP